MTGCWFSPATQVSSTNKTEILLKMALNTIKPNHSSIWKAYCLMSIYIYTCNWYIKHNMSDKGITLFVILYCLWSLVQYIKWNLSLRNCYYMKPTVFRPLKDVKTLYNCDIFYLLKMNNWHQRFSIKSTHFLVLFMHQLRLREE